MRIHTHIHKNSPTITPPSLSFLFTHLCMRIHTHRHKNSPTITPPSLLYFLFPSCFSMLSLSLEKLVTCGVIRSSSLKNEEVSQNCFVFHVIKVQKLGESRRIASFLMLSTLKNEEVSQNCFVFDVVKFKHWGSLAELLRFWGCQVQNLRTSRRIASFSSLQIDR